MSGSQRGCPERSPSWSCRAVLGPHPSPRRLHLSRSDLPFQVWGHRGEQRPGNAGRPTLLEHLAAAAVLCGQQEEVQERHSGGHQHHQQDGGQKAGAPWAASRVLPPARWARLPRKDGPRGSTQAMNTTAAWGTGDADTREIPAGQAGRLLAALRAQLCPTPSPREP